MKRKRLKSLVVVSAVLALFASPKVAGAEAVPWTSVYYHALAEVVEWDENQDLVFDDYADYFRTTPISAYYNYDNGSGGYGTASSQISSSDMQLQTFALESTPGYGLLSYSYAAFSGKYLGTADLLQLSYNVTVSSMPFLSFAVLDKTTGNWIYQTNLPTGSGTLNVSTPIGHDIQVNLTLTAEADSWNTGVSDGVKTDNASLNYSMSLVTAPEPISSILFVTGGTLLAGRSYLRKRRRHNKSLE